MSEKVGGGGGQHMPTSDFKETGAYAEMSQTDKDDFDKASPQKQFEIEQAAWKHYYSVHHSDGGSPPPIATAA